MRRWLRPSLCTGRQCRPKRKVLFPSGFCFSFSFLLVPPHIAVRTCNSLTSLKPVQLIKKAKHEKLGRSVMNIQIVSQAHFGSIFGSSLAVHAHASFHRSTWCSCARPLIGPRRDSASRVERIPHFRIGFSAEWVRASPTSARVSGRTSGKSLYNPARLPTRTRKRRSPVLPHDLIVSCLNNAPGPNCIAGRHLVAPRARDCPFQPVAALLNVDHV